MMANTLVCPVCGETNPADMEFCRNCQSRLLPLPASLKNESAPIQPGEPPTKKSTSELEPLLPQWLRDARQQARESEASVGPNKEPEQPATTAGLGSDLLAGLESQAADEDDEVPEWLANITGATTKKKRPVSEDNQVKWVELGRRDEKQGAAQESEATAQSAAQTAKPQKDDLSDWFKQAAASSETVDFQFPPASPASNAIPAATQESQPGAASQGSSQTEDLSWLRSLDAAASVQPAQTGDKTLPPRDEAPDWLKKLQAEQTAPAASQPPEQPASPRPADVPDWLKHFGEETSTTIEPEPAAQEPPASDLTLPDWLRVAGLAAASTEPAQPGPASEEPILPVELPDWISALGDGSTAPPPPTEPGIAALASVLDQPAPTPVEPAAPAALPDWISSLGHAADVPPSAAEPDKEAPASALVPPEHMSAEPAIPTVPSEWVASLGEKQDASAAPSESGTPGLLFGAAAGLAGAAFTQESLPGEDVDAIFTSMETPDWLSSIGPDQQPAEEGPSTPAQQEEPIEPAELPSWVQAMRPVESAMVHAGVGDKEAASEERGPLAGLQGVLPAIPGAVVPSSKPKPHSIKLDATEQQQAHAALLEQILAAETSPIPMRSSSVLRSQRVLRWALTVLVLLVVAAAVYSGSQVFALPTAVPNETVNAIQVVEALPEGAPVLLVFDYQPATVGEMEATGASLIDHLVVIKHPYLALVSTSPTGSALAERFMSTVLVDKGIPKYTRNQQYVDLGYLPGGLAGVYNFAQSPGTVLPADAAYGQILQTAGLPPVQRLSDFAAIVVLTDSLDSGRIWVEQTQATRGSSPMLMVSSAQAGPMLMPYVDAGQINGMVSGLYGAAAVEQRNAGSPAIYSPVGARSPDATLPGYVRRYWDAYNVGLYLAVALIVIVGLWNFLLGIRDRRAQAVE